MLPPWRRAARAGPIRRRESRCPPEAESFPWFCRVRLVAQVAPRPDRVTFHPEFCTLRRLRPRVAGPLPLARNPVERIAFWASETAVPSNTQEEIEE